MRVCAATSLGAVLTVLAAGCAAPVPAATSSAPPAALPVAAATATASMVSETRPAEATAATQSDSVEAQRAELRKARASFQAFLARADGNPDYAAAVESAKQRIEDIDRTLIFLGEETPGR